MPDAINQLSLVNDSQAAKRVSPDEIRQKEGQLKKACQDFESIFVNYMMKQMRQTVTKSSVMGTSQAEKLYTSMLDNEIAKNVSQARGIGLASILYEQMSGIFDAEQTKK